MIKRRVKNLELPVIGMGSAGSYDVETPEEIEVRKKILDNCISYGTNFVDTSPMYKRAEQVIGVTMEGKRDKFLLATKVWCSGRETGIKQIDRSFELMKTDHIEVMQIHNLIDWRTHLPVLEEMKAEGKIDLIGLSHYAEWALPEMAEIMRTGRIDTVQISYNVMEREVEKEILPLAESMGIGVIVMRPVGHGILINRLERQPDLTPLREFGIETWGQALMAWLISDTRVSALIPATTKPERVIENSKAGERVLPKEAREYVVREAQRCLKPGKYTMG
jgi:aryl-alcohol dehydrogenase-like predicted oxidoreductase